MKGTKLLGASHPSLLEPAGLFKFVPELVLGEIWQTKLIDRQILPNFVQVETAFFVIHDPRAVCLS